MADAFEEEVTICNGGVSMIQGGRSGGLLLPVGGNWERRFGPIPQAILLFLGLAYCFAGVAKIADVFMSAIEKITSERVRVVDKDTGKGRTYYVWNPTVANLTLMALGSSAPEILLSVIELMSNEMQAGELGPSTIVGSAAFNLLVIIAICVSCIPSGEARAIKELPVFAVTAVFSVFAYLWLLVILLVISPNVVQWWEGLITFAFFPVLCLLAYAADKGLFHRMANMSWDGHSRYLVLTADTTEDEKKLMVMKVMEKYGDSKDVEDNMQDLLHFEFDPKPTRCQLRRDGTRQMFGSNRKTGTKYSQLRSPTADTMRKNLLDSRPVSAASTVEFVSTHYVVKESAGKVECEIERKGDLKQQCRIHVRTIDGSAEATSDYKAINEDIIFKPKQSKAKVSIPIYQDGETEDTEDFTVEITPVRTADPGLVQVGPKNQATVVIIDSDNPGVIKFQNSQLQVEESSDQKMVTIEVYRTHGTHGAVSCSYHTEDDTALENIDYRPISGTLKFANGEAQKTLQVTILPKGRPDMETFRLVVDSPKGGVKFDDTEDGDEESSICTIMIVGKNVPTGILGSAMSFNADRLETNKATWRSQFTEAIYVNGDPEAASDATIGETICHVLLMPWKLLCAFVPPPDMCQGWLCFFVALLVIGALTALIGDLADMLGCALNMEPSITAITLVAIGTSLPDTFASSTSAIQEDTADNSIGNVTGSNSVNVFLGLGMPWAIGAIYWHIQGVDLNDENDPWVKHGKAAGWWYELPEIAEKYPATFVVPAGSLCVSVLTFSICAVACLVTIVLRRRELGAELGGPDMPKYFSSAFFLSLWIIYIVVSIVSA